MTLSTGWGLLCRSALVREGFLRSRGFHLPRSPAYLLARLFGRRVTFRIWLQMQTQIRGLQRHLIQACHWVPYRRGFVYPLIHVCITMLPSSVYRQQLPWVAFLKTQVLYYQVNFLSVLFAWSKSDILWPVRFMAAFPHSFPRPINTSGYKPSSFFSLVASILSFLWEINVEEFLNTFLWHRILMDCFTMNFWQIQMSMYWLLFYESNAWFI